MFKALLVRTLAIAVVLDLAGAAAGRADTNLMMTIENNTGQTLYWLGDETKYGNINEYPASIAPGSSAVVQATHHNGKGGGGFAFGTTRPSQPQPAGLKWIRMVTATIPSAAIATTKRSLRKW